MAKKHVDALVSARDRLVESRRQLAVALGRPFQRGRWKIRFACATASSSLAQSATSGGPTR